MTTGQPEQTLHSEEKKSSPSSIREALAGLNNDPEFAFQIPNDPGTIESFLGSAIADMSAHEYHDLEQQIADAQAAVARGEESERFVKRKKLELQVRREHFQELSKRIIQRYPLLPGTIDVMSIDNTRQLGRFTFPRFAHEKEIRVTATREQVGDKAGALTQIIKRYFGKEVIQNERLLAALFPEGQMNAEKNMNLIMHVLLPSTPVWNYMVEQGAQLTDFGKNTPVIVVQVQNMFEFQKVFANLTKDQKVKVLELMKNYSGGFTRRVGIPGSFGQFISAQAQMYHPIEDIRISEDGQSFVIQEGPIDSFTIEVTPNSGTGEVKPSPAELATAIQSTKEFLQNAGL